MFVEKFHLESKTGDKSVSVSSTCYPVRWIKHKSSLLLNHCKKQLTEIYDMNFIFHFNSTKVKGNQQRIFCWTCKIKHCIAGLLWPWEMEQNSKVYPLSLTCLKRSSSMYVTFSLRLVPSNRPSSKGIAMNRSVNYLPINQEVQIYLSEHVKRWPRPQPSLT